MIETALVGRSSASPSGRTWTYVNLLPCVGDDQVEEDARDPIRAAFAEQLHAQKVFYERVLKRLRPPTTRFFSRRTPRSGRGQRERTQELREYLRRAGIPATTGKGRGLDIHCMRHTAASRMARAA